ncbi:MAG TPA: hypothetical protein VLE02_02075 [Nitrosarchaeum sp.]|nr:hypothetical protein [Nitrosarchaeum sp.]
MSDFTTDSPESRKGKNVIKKNETCGKEYEVRFEKVVGTIINFVRELKKIYTKDKGLKKYLNHVTTFYDSRKGAIFTIDSFDKFLSEYVPKLFEDDNWYKDVSPDHVIWARGKKDKLEIGKFLHKKDSNQEAITEHLRFIYFTIHPQDVAAKEKFSNVSKKSSASQLVKDTLDNVKNIATDEDCSDIGSVVSKAVSSEFFSQALGSLKDGVDNQTLSMKDFVNEVNNEFSTLLPGLSLNVSDKLIDEVDRMIAK